MCTHRGTCHPWVPNKAKATGACRVEGHERLIHILKNLLVNFQLLQLPRAAVSLRHVKASGLLRRSCSTLLLRAYMIAYTML